MTMRLGILGSTGFVGRNMMAVLSDRVTLIGGSRSIGVDASDPLQIRQWLGDNKITHLVNLAAECGGIGLNARCPADLWHAATVIGTNVLKAANEARLKRIIQVGTVCSYARDNPVPFLEDSLMRYGFPESTNLAYGVAKLSGLVGAHAYAKQYGLDVWTLIPVNMYGSNDHFDLENSHVIPALIKKISDAMSSGSTNVSIWGTGTATREFLYVDDFIEAVWLAINKPSVPVFVNIGTGIETSIKNVASAIGTILGYNGTFGWDSSRPDGQPRRCLSIERAKTLLGYQPKTSVFTGLVSTIAWYKEAFKR